MLDRLPTAYIVKHLHEGKLNKFVTLHRTKADEYAAMHHGTIHPLYEDLPPPTAEKVEEAPDFGRVSDE